MSNEEKIMKSINLITSMVEEGYSEKEIAEKIEVAYSTFKRIKAGNDTLKQQMAHAKDIRNLKVERALYKNAIGYHYYEEVVTKVKEEVLAEDGATILVKEDVKISSIKKYKGPDLAAQKYWLGNKKKTEWKEDPHKVANDKENIKIKKKELESKSISI